MLWTGQVTVYRRAREGAHLLKARLAEWFFANAPARTRVEPFLSKYTLAAWPRYRLFE